jgi:hypothetical protein
MFSRPRNADVFLSFSRLAVYFDLSFLRTRESILSLRALTASGDEAKQSHLLTCSTAFHGVVFNKAGSILPLHDFARTSVRLPVTALRSI